MAMNAYEHFLYHSQSPWTMTSVGQMRSAIETGMAALIPSFFAGMDAAEMMLRRSEGSPDTTEGTRRMSGLPSCISCTERQDKKAEFTSM